jgi:hypothetical protein
LYSHVCVMRRPPCVYPTPLSRGTQINSHGTRDELHSPRALPMVTARSRFSAQSGQRPFASTFTMYCGPAIIPHREHAPNGGWSGQTLRRITPPCPTLEAAPSTKMNSSRRPQPGTAQFRAITARPWPFDFGAILKRGPLDTETAPDGLRGAGSEPESPRRNSQAC